MILCNKIECLNANKDDGGCEVKNASKSGQSVNSMLVVESSQSTLTLIKLTLLVEYNSTKLMPGHQAALNNFENLA